MKSCLVELGDSRRLRLLVRLIESRLGFIVRAAWDLIDLARSAAKKWLRLFLLKSQ